jgi:tetrahydromethanopterin S-methyltransferase subunit B
MRDIMEAMDGRCDAALAKDVIASKINELKERADQIQRVIEFLQRGPDPDRKLRAKESAT